MIKTIKSGIFILTACLFVACGVGEKMRKIAGEWKLTGLTEFGEKVELSDCDKKTTWNFTTNSAMNLVDGTVLQELKAQAPDDCENYGFDSEWTVKDGNLFTTTIRFGGVDGYSMAGLMEIKELTDKKLVFKSMNKEITLEK